ncbi:hypothetical protein JW835_01010 [bacterium]|nr:hypothetical protein [bacterium]
MKKVIRILIGIILLLSLHSFAQGYKLTSDDIILLKQNNFTETTLQKLIDAPEINISVDELIRLKQSELSEDTILKLAIKKETVPEKRTPATQIVNTVRPKRSRNTFVRYEWMVGLSGGGAIGQYTQVPDDNSMSQFNPSLAFRFGRMFDKNLLLCIEVNGWMPYWEENDDITDHTIDFVLGTLSATYFFGKPGTILNGIFIQGGIGGASGSITWIETDELTMEESDAGWGFFIGAGYECPVFNKLTLGMRMSYNQMFFGGDNLFESARFTPLLLDVNYYF